jgi:tryptophan-rich sensory protein
MTAMTAPSTKRERPYVSLAGWLALTLGTGAIGALGSRDAPVFYQQLSRPSWAPPAAVFGPVWTSLYLLMGFAAWLVWRSRDKHDVRLPLTLFVTQLGLNALWSWLFFGWRMGAASLADVIILVAFVATTLVMFWRVRTTAGVLLVPYLAWVTFATALTASVWQRNPALL